MTAPAMLAFNPGAKVVNQPDQRREDYFQDQHGRFWYATVEVKTGDPVGGLYPVDGWQAPTGPSWCRGRFRPDSKYLVIRRERGKPATLFVDYDQWEEDWRVGLSEWQASIRDLAATSAGTGGLAVEWLKKPPKEILALVGHGPQRKIPLAMIRAMKQGNRWALGLTDTVPPWAEPILKAWEVIQKTTPADVLNIPEEFPDAPDPVAEDRLDVEEDEDPEATGGKTMKFGKQK